MIVIQNATVVRVMPFEDKNQETGVISNIHKVDLQHMTNDLPTSQIEIVTIKLKEQVQADAFQRFLNQQINIPARVWAVGGGTGFWLEKGVLPTPVRQVAPVQAQPKAA